MFKAFIFSLFAFMAAFAPSAHAQEVMFDLPVPHDLVEFVSAHTGVHLPDGLQIGVVDNASKTWDYRPAWSQGIVLAASGMEKEGKIYLPVRSVVHLQDDKYRAIVVHELTHIAQEKQNRRFACNDQREAQAYQVQNEFLLENGLQPAMDDAAVAALKSCGNGILIE